MKIQHIIFGMAALVSSLVGCADHGEVTKGDDSAIAESAATGAMTLTSYQGPIGDGSIVGYNLYQPPGYAGGSSTWPLVIFLHGTGQRAAGSTPHLDRLSQTGLPQVIEQGLSIPFLVVAPQVTWSWNGQGSNINALLQHVSQLYRVDAQRVFVTGLSDGGKGVFDFTYDYPEKVRAIVPISTWPSTNASSHPERFVGVHMWSFMGSSDTYGALQNFTTTVSGLGGDARFELLSGGHSADVWNRVYQGHDFDIYTWMLSTAPSAAPAPQRWLVNFHPSPDGTSFGAGWNTVYQSLHTAENLLDEGGAPTALSVTINNGVSAKTGGVVTGNDSGVFPDAVMNGFLYVASGSVGAVDLTGLDPSRSYTLSALASRAGTGTRNTRFTADGVSVTIQAMNNASQVATLDNLHPDSAGKLRLEFSADQSDWGYLNALTLESAP